MYATARKLPNGDLLVTADNATRAGIKEALADERNGFWGVLADLFEGYFTNGSYEPFDAGDGNPFVGLTSVPCIAESMSYLDNGDKRIDGDFWYFDNYMLVDPLDELKRKGRVIFTLAR